jgi:hypothetical protein
MPDASDVKPKAPSEALVSWVSSRVTDWRAVRDSTYKADWDNWYRLWRGQWDPSMKERKSERSRLISPASMMAVDLTVAEIVEGIFGRDYWFDIPDDIADQDKADAEKARDMLRQDLFEDGVIGQMTEIALNGALYGTGIAKIVLDVVEQAIPRRNAEGAMVRTMAEKVRIYPAAVEPGQLIPDPAGTTLDNGLGFAIEMKVPLHSIKKKQRAGIYRRDAVVTTGFTEPGVDQRKEEGRGGQEDFAVVVEYHGLVPAHLLVRQVDDVAAGLAASMDEDEMVEAIVTYANEGALLRGIANPAVMQDRGGVSYQHSKVPNRFWGRGVMEKAKHPQKALDAEMRSRVDSLAWISNPMIAGDLTKLPARMDLNVWPGKFWGTKGPPGEAIQEFRFGDVNASTFEQTSELERQVQQATGALDSIMSIRGGVRDESATGAALSASGFIKRSKLTMFAIEEFLGTLLRRILWRKMQFEPERYPFDFEFQVKGTVGMMAREIEQQFMVSLLQFTEQGTPPYLLILKAVFEQSSSPVKGEVRAAIEAMLNPEPDPEKEAMVKAVEKAQAQLAVEEVRNVQADTALKLANAGFSGAREMLTRIDADLRDEKAVLDNLKVIIDKEETNIMAEQNQISREKLELERKKLSQGAATSGK